MIKIDVIKVKNINQAIIKINNRVTINKGLNRRIIIPIGNNIIAIKRIPIIKIRDKKLRNVVRHSIIITPINLAIIKTKVKQKTIIMQEEDNNQIGIIIAKKIAI